MGELGTEKTVAQLSAELEDARAQIASLTRSVESERDLRLELERAEQSLREHDARWLLAIEGTGVGVLDWDISTGAMTFSDRWLSITGYARDELPAHVDALTSLVHPDDLPMALADIEEVLAGRKALHAVEHRLEHKLGHWIWVQSRSLVSAWGENHKPLRMIGTHVDISERRHVEDALRDSETRFRVLADGAPVVLFVSDVDGGNRFVNRTYCEYFGVTPEEAEAGKWQPLLHPDDAGDYVASFMTAVRERAPFREETRVRGHSGEWRWIDVVSEPRISPAGEYLGHVGVVVDITDRKLAEDERARLQNQLLHSAKMELVGRLAGGVAHDFNNMLAVILGRVELAVRHAGSTEVRDDLREIRDAAQHSADLVRQLLAFARKQPILPRLLDLNEAVDAIVAMLRRLIGENIDLRWQPVPELWHVVMDPTQIDRILTNLCINARDAIVDAGTITIEVTNVTVTDDECAKHPGRSPGDYVRLAVRDDGSGMTQETQAHLFEPFFTTKGVGKGTGLGLPTIHGIVDQNHGFMHVVSAPGAGTTFEIYLPRSVAEPERAAAPVERPVRRATETILLVEDEPALLTIARKVLEQSGYVVLATSSPSEALRIAAEHSGAIHLLLTDVIMPEMNGPDLAKALRSRFHGLKELFMSGHTADAFAGHDMVDEDMSFIAKPFSGEVLTAKVRALLDGDR